MNSINANLNMKQQELLKKQPGFGAANNSVSNYTEPASEVQIPDLYYVPDNSNNQKGFKETLKQVDVMGMVYPWLEHPLLLAGTCAATSYGLDKFTQACSGEYEQSLLAKAGRLGDRIENSKIANSNSTQRVLGWGKSLKKQINKLTQKSDVINAIKTTPSMPEWSLVKDELLTQEQRIVHEFSHITNTLHLIEEEAAEASSGLMDIGKSKCVGLNKLALTKEEKDLVKNISKETDAVNTVLLKRLGRSDAEIKKIIDLGDGATKAVKNEILKEMGLTEEELRNITKDLSPENIKKVKAAAGKVKNKVWIGAGNYSILGPIQPFERRIGCDEVYNRLHSLSEGAATKTGRLMSKFMQRCHRGFTFGGGKICILLFVAPRLVETMVDTKKADPNAKVGTAANGIIDAISWVFTFPLGLKIMHSFGGMQYAGMGKEKVEQYRKLLNDFNHKVKSDFFKSKDEYIKEKKILKTQLKELKKVDGQNLLTKACRKLGSFITMDLETIKSYRGGNIAGNTARKVPNFFKNLGGVPLRFALWSAITMMGLDALISKGTKAIFGNFYDRTKEEEHEEKKKQQKEFLKQDLQARLLEAQKKKLEEANAPKENNTPIGGVTPAQEVKTNANKPEEQTATPSPAVATELNELNQDKKAAPELPVEQNKTLKRDNYTYIPSQENVFNNSNTNPPRKYIPSQEAANIVKNFDNSKLEPALRRADRAEAKALEVLSGNFNGM